MPSTIKKESWLHTLKKKKLLQLSFSLLLGVFFIYLSVKDLTQNEVDAIINSFTDINYLYMLLAFFISIASHYLRAIRWNYLLQGIGINISHAQRFHAVMIGYLANLGIPRLGELVRCGIIQKQTKEPMVKIVGTLIFERTVDSLIMLILTLYVFLSQFEVVSKLLLKMNINLDGIISGFMGKLFLVGMFALIMLALIYLIRNTKFGLKAVAKLKEAYQGFLSLKTWQHMLNFLIQTILIWSMYVAMFYLASQAFSQLHNLSFGVIITAYTMSIYAMLLTQGGLGAFPLIIVAVLTIFNIERAAAFSAGWAIWTIQTLAILVPALFSLVLYNKTTEEVK